MRLGSDIRARPFRVVNPQPMKIYAPLLIGALLLSSLVLVTGCGKSGPSADAPPPMTKPTTQQSNDLKNKFMKEENKQEPGT